MSRLDRIIIAIVGGAVVLAAAAGYVLLAPTGFAPATAEPGSDPLTAMGPVVASEAPPATIVVDVGGAVVQPGVHELPSGARIADAIDAAGGFGPDADLGAVADLNLAQPLVDGQQVRVARIGEGMAAGAPPGSGASGTGGGLVNVNTATPDQLQALPGIGPVTVQKIVAARQEQPFSSLQDMVDRGVIHRGQLEDITDLATAG